jgi:membrane protease YdiL (CAAX protease family)
MGALSLLARRAALATLGFRRLRSPGRAVLILLGLTAAWALLKVALVLPVLERLTGQRQHLSQFADLQGDLPLLLTLLGLSWTLAALGEETAYRGYLNSRLTDLVGTGRTGVVLAVIASSTVFALATPSKAWSAWPSRSSTRCCSPGCRCGSAPCGHRYSPTA